MIGSGCVRIGDRKLKPSALDDGHGLKLLLLFCFFFKKAKLKKIKKEKRKDLVVDGVRLVIPGFGSDTKLMQWKLKVQNIPLILENVGIKEQLNSR